VGGDSGQKPPTLKGAKSVDIDFNKTTIYDLVKFFAQITGKNFIISDESKLKQEVTIISHKKVSSRAAYEAFLSALEVTGYTTVEVGKNVKIIESGKGVQSPIRVSSDESIPRTDQVITQLIPLDNVSAQDLQSLVKTMASPKANVNAYLPSNTLIITDHAYNIRKIFKMVSELDVAAPKSRMEFVGLTYAEADQVKTIIEQLYGVSGSSSASESTSSTSSRSRRRDRRRRNRDAEPAQGADSVTAGKKAKYIDKVMSDERTNTLIVLANDEGHEAVRKLVAELDRDITDSSRSKIHVVRLEHAKSEEVTQVLESLANGSSRSSSSSRNSRTNTRTSSRNRIGANTPNSRSRTAATAQKKDGFGAVAAFEDGLRIASDEATNSLVIIASPEDFRVLKNVIDELDQKRRQVFVDAVIVELTSDDNFDFGFGVHAPTGQPSDGGGYGFASGQMGQSSFGLSQELLSGLALGVFGDSISVPTELGDMTIPAFGVVLHALKTYAGFNVISNPNILTVDNEEAEIVVGEKVPFPQASQFNSLTNQPMVTYTREDVAITLKLTPRVNSSNYVTLDVTVEVAEVKEDQGAVDPLLSGGPTTTNRKVDTMALVKDNQTVVLGGLMSTTDTEVETKVPILGDIPILGGLFRGKKTTARKRNLLIFLTPHIVEDEEDMMEIMRVKEAQFREFRRRFYGRSKEQQLDTMNDLLQYSMNFVDRESAYRGKTDPKELSGKDVGVETGASIRQDLGRSDYSRDESASNAEPSNESDDGVPEEENAVEPLAVPAGDEE
jgi:general secretion pathway protein D